MALVVKDRVKQTSTTTGTGSIVLNGTVAGFQTFTSALTDGDTTYYAIVEPSTGSWEVGLGTWTEATATLARTTVLESSNSGSAINLTAQSEVFITQPASKAVYTDASGNLNPTGNVDVAGTLDVTGAATFDDSVTIQGDLTVNGTTTTVNATNLAVADNMIYLNDGSTTTNPDLGWAGNYNDGTYAHAGIFRDASDATFKFYDGYVPEPGIAIDTTHATFSLADVDTGNLDVTGNITVSGTVDGRDVAADGTKLDGIEAGATGDQTASEILTAIKTVDGATSGLDADLLDGQEGSYYLDWTHTTNKPDPTVTLSGDVSGSATMTDLGSINITTTVANDSHTHDGRYYTETEVGNFFGGTTAITGYNKSNWDTAYGWGNHASAGYLAASSYTAADVLTKIKTVDGAASGLDADLLDGTQLSAITHSGDSVTITGAVTGSTTVGADGSISIATTATSDPTLTLSGDASGSATFTNLGNATLNVTVANDSHTHDGRYYTESEADSRFVRADGANAMTGDLLVQDDIKSTGQIRATGWWNNNTGTTGNDLAVEMGVSSGSGYVISYNRSTSSYGSLNFNATAFSFDKRPTFSGNTAFDDGYHPNADKWTTARTLSLSGDASGSVSWDGSANATLSVTVADDSHNHTHSDGGFTVNGNLVVTGDIDVGSQLNTWIQSDVMTDAIGWNTNFGVYIGSNVGGTHYLRGNGTFTTGGSTYNLWHAGNDGAGSGLDADTLDGVQGSSYLRSDTSDTFTGTLTLTGSMNASGTVYAESLQEDYDALSGTTPSIDADNGGAFSLTMTGNTTFTFGSVTSGRSVGFILQLTGNGGTVTWPASVDWAGGTAPDAPASGETDIYVFWSRDGGTTWYGVQSIDAAA